MHALSVVVRCMRRAQLHGLIKQVKSRASHQHNIESASVQIMFQQYQSSWRISGVVVVSADGMSGVSVIQETTLS